jgi:SAM-dependent methyltransferase
MGQYYKRDFWQVENRKYARPGFRMLKTAGLIREMARDSAAGSGRPCDLLDVGCGPAALAGLTGPDVRYHGIDIAITAPAGRDGHNLREVDFLQAPIGFDDKTFDLVTALGVFEYLGEFQQDKLAEIAGLLNPGGRFVVSYVNFGHRKRNLYWPYSNVQDLASFRDGLAEHFDVLRDFPVGHNWLGTEPNRPWLQAAQLHLNRSIPLVSPRFAVEYLFICARRP